MSNYGIVSLHDYRKKLAYAYELITTAYHEAGHTIYGLLHYKKITSVVVFQNKKSKRVEGFTYYEDYSPQELSLSDIDLISNRLKSEICIFYAGLVAEKNFFKLTSGSSKFPSFLKEGSSEDIAIASRLIRKFNLASPGEKRYALKQKLLKETSQELELHWDATTIVAQNLFQKKKLSYSNIKDLLIRKSDKKFWKEQFKQIDFIFDNSGYLDEKEIKSIIL